MQTVQLNMLAELRKTVLPLLLCAVAEAIAADNPPEALADQIAAYQLDAPKTVLELQQFRTAQRVPAVDASGRRGQATLVNLNPETNAWFVLTLDWGKTHDSYHLENPSARTQQLALSEKNPTGLEITFGGRMEHCDLWRASPVSELRTAQRLAGAYEPLCGGRLYLRNQVAGTYTPIERATDILRDHVPGGDRIVGFVKREFFQDAFLVKEPLVNAIDAGQPSPASAPLRPAIDPAYQGRGVPSDQLALELEKASGTMELGRWYPAKGLAGIFVSAFEPAAVPREILDSSRGIVSTLGPIESKALVYVVAFDLSSLDLEFMVGTDHPRVGWSERTREESRTKLTGPDGIDTVAPLARTGMVSPPLAGRTVAAFTGGFKRVHGAFHVGPYARRNHGSHYGFIEQGAVLSKLVPGLATLVVFSDGSVDMRTWSKEDDRLLAKIRHARQNGLPLIEPDAMTGAPVPGEFVAQWAAGNWSGSADNAELRALRAGACLQQPQGARFLLYGYFSDATPSAMARVFQAYHCSYAMHLDMNALEHTYLALYERRDGKITVEHLINGMGQVDKKGRGRNGSLLPRFLGFPDDRDFFYLVPR